jgi:Tol biopolymer transport system component
VFLVPAIGGAERKLTEIDCCQVPLDGSLEWSPDGKWLATADTSSAEQSRCLFLLSSEDGEKRRLTLPPPGWLNDRTPAFSPDGRALAFVRQKHADAAELFVLPLSHDAQPTQKPIQLTFDNGWIGAPPAWNSDGSAIIFSSYRGQSLFWLWRVPFPAGGTPERLVSFGDHSFEPAISSRLHRLVYTRVIAKTNTWRLEVPTPGGKASLPVKLLSSTRADFNAQYAPDGKHIAFHSTRSAWSEIWVCNSDGSNARQLTFLKAPMTGSPRWSPDGNRIVFDSNLEGQYELYTIDVDGGKPQRLTSNISDDGVGSWSQDGKSIYFASNRSGEWQVWKIAAGGGDAVQITRHGGYVAFESPDRRFVYYSKARGETSLWRVPVRGGKERQVLESVSWMNFAVVPEGIFFLPGHTNQTHSIQFFNFLTAATMPIAPIEGTVDIGLSVSPDQRYILYSQNDQQSSELMLVEKFW